MKIVIDNAVYVDTRNKIKVKDNGVTCCCGKCEWRLVAYHNDIKEIRSLYTCTCGNILGVRIKGVNENVKEEKRTNQENRFSE